MTRINTNLSSLTAQHSLKKSNSALETALTRLSTGLRINSGKDDPAGLIASEQLRTEVTSITQSIKNSERAGNMIATADAALGEVSSLLNDVRNLIQSSANKGAVSSQEIAANQVEVDNALDAITRIAQTTVFGGQKLLNGTKAFSVAGTLGAFNSPSDIQVNTFDPSLHTATANDDVSVTVTAQATKKSVSFKGNDYNTSASNSLLDLSVGSSTRTTATIVTNDYSLANTTSSLNSLSTGSTRYQRVIEGGATGLADLSGTGADTVTFDVTGNLGTTSISVNVANAKANTQVLADAINAVSAQTGVWASAASATAGADLTLQSTYVGTTGTTATLTATAASHAATATTVAFAGGASFTGLTGDAGTATVRTLEGGATGGDFANLVGGGGTSITFDLTGNLGTATGISVGIDALKADSTALVTAINLVSGTTGITASSAGGAGADVTLTNGAVGATGITFANVAGAGGANAGDVTDFSAAITGGSQTLGTAAETITFDVTGNLGTTNVSVGTAALKANSNALVAAINAATGTTGVTASSVGGAGAAVTLTRGVTGPGALTLSNFGGTGGSDVTDFQTAYGAATTTAGTNSDLSEFNAAITGSVVTAGTNGALNTKTTEFTITGNKGSAIISTAALSVGGLTGNDVIINNNTANDDGIEALAALINTRTDSTGVIASVNANTHNLVLTSQGVGASSLANLTVATAGNDQNILASASTKTVSTGSTGTSNTTTLELIGDLGRSVITVDNDAVINDSTTLRNAINAVSAQTGITASGGGFGADVSLSARNYGSGGTVTVNALAASNSNDIALLNNASSRTVVDGANATGTVSHSKGGGSFTGTGERISFTDSALSFDATIDPTLTAATRAARTVQDTTAGAGGLDSLTGTGTDTISFQLSGVVNGAQVTTNINNVNVAALKADSRVLADLINATSSTSGVRATTSGASGNIVLESTTLGANGLTGIVATAATQAGDVTAFNNADTLTGVTSGANPATASNFDVSGGALFQIGPSVNYTNQVNVNITSLDLATLGRNYSTTGNKGLSALKSGGTDDLDTADLGTAATIVEQAISQVATLRGKLGAIQKNAVESNIRSLQTSLEQVTAAKSTISDADFAVETAALTRSQILVQAGTNVLALANQAPQNVLSLLRG